MSQELERMIEVLRVEPEPPDDVSRARWLARMSPELDAIALRRTTPRTRRLWLAAGTLAAAAAALAWWFGHAAPARQPGLAVIPMELDVLRPYAIAGEADEARATTLLAGRFATLDVGAEQQVRASLPGDTRLGLVGPATARVQSATSAVIELEVAGTLLVDAHGDAPALRVHAGGEVVRGQHAVFAMQRTPGGLVVFVERGEVELGTARLGSTRLGAGEWAGPPSTALVARLREHLAAAAPPSRAAGILAVAGDGVAMTRAGALLGAAPVWARVAPGTIAVVVGERPAVDVEIRDGAVTRVAPPVVAERAPDVVPPRGPEVVPPRSPEVVPPRSKLDPAPAVAAAVQEPAAAPTAAELYARAEAALAAGDRAGAEATWRELVATFPDAPQAASAHYDLANSARVRGDLTAARAELARLLAGSPPDALREPADYLACRLDVETHDLAAAQTCFATFRTRHATSPHDAEVLAWLAGRLEDTGGCVAAHALAAEYVQRYPSGPFAARAKRCAP